MQVMTLPVKQKRLWDGIKDRTLWSIFAGYYLQVTRWAVGHLELMRKKYI